MKKLIMTMQIGDKYKETWDLMTPHIKDYAEKCNADFKILTNYRIEWKKYGFFMNKFIMFEELDKYDRLLTLDSDILITPNAPDIFKVFPDTDTFYGVDESYTDRAHIVKPYIGKYDVNWELSIYGTPKHYNGGVWLFGKDCDISYDIEEYLPIKGYEENFLNYVIQKNNVKNINMPRTWNKICSDDTIPRRKAHFIHYAGPGHVQYDDTSEIKSKKKVLIQSDVDFFYG